VVARHEISVTRDDVAGVLPDRYPYAARYAVAQAIAAAWEGRAGLEWHCRDCRFLAWSPDWESGRSEPECWHPLDVVADNQADVGYGALCWGFRPRGKEDPKHRSPRDVVERAGLPYEWAVRAYMTAGYDAFVMAVSRLRYNDPEGYIDEITRDPPDDPETGDPAATAPRPLRVQPGDDRSGDGGEAGGPSPADPARA
jgi:hypothetical protein